MKDDITCTVVCEHTGPHEAVVSYSGAICHAGAIALERHFKNLFDYYQYNRIDLRLESQGGSIEALHYILRQMNAYEKRGKQVGVRSTFVCASAAAILLAMGQWGGRSVDRSTALLFHSARVQAAGHGMTAAISTNLSQTLNWVDIRLIDLLVERLVTQAGGEEALTHLVLERCHTLDCNWNDVASKLSSMYPEAESKRRPDWFKSLNRTARAGLERGKFPLDLKKQLYKRMQHDSRMDVREAYCTGLLDQVVDVLDANLPAPASKSAVDFVALGVTTSGFNAVPNHG
jgi:Clp protease